MPGRKPFGYYSGEAEIIAKMEALRAAGLGFDSIADRLNAADVPSRSGKLWSGIVINRILTRGPVLADEGTRGESRVLPINPVHPASDT